MRSTSQNKNSLVYHWIRSNPSTHPSQCNPWERKIKKIINTIRFKKFTAIPPWEFPLQAFTFRVKSCAQTAIKAMYSSLMVLKPDVASWTDGSVTNDGKAGAGSILYRYQTDLPPIEYSLRVKDDSTADECEWWATYMSIMKARESIRVWSLMCIFTDNHTQEVRKKKWASGLNSLLRARDDQPDHI